MNEIEKNEFTAMRKKVLQQIRLKENFLLGVTSPVQTSCTINFAWPWLILLLCGAASSERSRNYL